MTERPIVLRRHEVVGIIAGTQTQVRRVVKPRDLQWMDEHQGLRESDNALRCPYGKPGDRLWGRESYWADATTCNFMWYVNDIFTPDRKREHCRLLHGIFMPRKLSRITLEVTGVRVERLQDISEADAMAEGVERVIGKTGGVVYRTNADHRFNSIAIGAYALLWESINGPGSWDLNPWVRVVEFKTLKEQQT